MILDTNAVSALLAGDSIIESLLSSATRHELPAIVIGEYRFGLMRSRYKGRLETALELLTRESRVLEVGVETARHYALARERLRLKGRPIPENDVWISALALEHRIDVLSNDAHFDWVEGLKRVGWGSGAP